MTGREVPPRRWRGALGVCVLALVLAACTATLVQPYDEKLIADTEAFYKTAAAMIEQGKAVSPRTDAARAAIADPASHPGHFSAFAARYDDLIVESEAFILRAAAQSGAIDEAGGAIHRRFNEVIESVNPSNCPELRERFRETSLTVANLVDLKCLVVTWRAQHADDGFTRNTKILKQSNWDGRKLILFNAVLAIQQAEASKNKGN